MNEGLDSRQLIRSKDSIAKLNDIKGYWDMSFTGDYNEVNMWEGQMILYEDGWFEGIVRDPNSSYKEDRFIFGAYFPGMAIELLKVTPGCISNPFAFRGKKNDGSYEGEFSLVSLFGEQNYGVCQISIKESEKKDTKDLQFRIDRWKESIAEDENRYLYDNTVRMRNQFIEILKRKYQGIGFTEEEVKELFEAVAPINQDVFDKTAETVRGMLKTLNLKRRNSRELEDDLPF